MSSSASRIRDFWETPEGLCILGRLQDERINIHGHPGRADFAVRNAFVPRDLRGINFADADLRTDFLLFDVDLSGSSFAHSRLRGSFQGSTLRDCDFSDAQIFFAYFGDSTLTDAKFDRAVIHGADFLQTNMSGCSFKNAEILAATFFATDLRKVAFDGALLGEVSFARCQLLDTPDMRTMIANAKELRFPETIRWEPH